MLYFLFFFKLFCTASSNKTPKSRQLQLLKDTVAVNVKIQHSMDGLTQLRRETENFRKILARNLDETNPQPAKQDEPSIEEIIERIRENDRKISEFTKQLEEIRKMKEKLADTLGSLNNKI